MLAGAPDVAKILSENMSSLCQRRAFAKLRNQGIVQVNKERFVKDNHNFERIKKGQASETVHCTVCQGSYTKEYLYRHKKR